jgi:CSLREA domain-containing protein
MRRILGLFMTCALVACLIPAAAGAATITPNIFTDELNAANANCSLREAVSIANTDATTAEPDCAITNGGLGDDTISLGAGNYVLDIVGTGEDANANGDLDVLSGGGDLTIDGVGSAVATPTTIDTDTSPPWTERVLHKVAGSATPLVISELTISGGKAPGLSGGGIFAATGDLTLQSARVTNNTAGIGGGVRAAITLDALSILDSVVDGNTSTELPGGGGVSSEAATTTIDSSIVTDNNATFSGGSGGGIRAAGAGTQMTITDSIIESNTAESTDASQPVGGGIKAESGALVTVRGTTLSGNEVVSGTEPSGGGMFVTGAATVATIVNSTFSGNESLSTGGSGAGIWVSGGTANVVHSTFGPNPVVPAGGFGSAIQRSSGALNIRGSVVETSGAATACEPGAGVINSQGFNVFTDSSCGGLASDEQDADPLLGALEDNGGPGAGRPDALVPILTLLPAQTSPVVDHVPAGNCADELLAPLLLDQRGLERPFDGDGNGTADCDAGSVELQTAPTPPPPPPPPPATGGGQPTTQPPVITPVAKKKCKKAKKRAAAAKKKCKKKHKK